MASHKKGPAISVQFEGIEELRAALDGLRKNEIARVSRNAVGAIAAELRDDIRQNLPQNIAHHAKDIVVKRPRARSTWARADVMARGKKVGGDETGELGFSHWHFFEYGTEERFTKDGDHRGSMWPTPFKNPAVQRMSGKIEERFTELFLQKIEDQWNKM